MFGRKNRGEAKLLQRISELEKHVAELENNLIHDRLTGLKTRAFFDQEATLYLSLIRVQDGSQKYGQFQRREKFGFKNLAIIFFDIDHFKTINDTYGHDVGDEVLKVVAQTIQTGLRTGDTTARWGGEEIVSSLLGAEEGDAVAKAEEIRKKVEQIIIPGYQDLKVTISAGVTSTGNSLSLPELMKHADLALYKAKNDGRNRVVAYSTLSQVPQLATA